MARSVATRLSNFSPCRNACARSASRSWVPIVWTGFNAFCGSWNTMAAAVPRRDRSVSAGAPTTWVPVSSMDPEACARSGSRPSTDSAVSDLPDPDSPTSATISAGSTFRLMPLTTRWGPSGVSNSTSSPLTRSSPDQPRRIAPNAWDTSRNPSTNATTTTSGPNAKAGFHTR